MTVLEALRLEHPESGRFSSKACKPFEDLPPMVELDVCGGHIQTVAHWLRGGAGPGGSDTGASQDWLLRYRAHSEHLRDAVACLTHVIANSLMPFHFIRALMSSRLVALDKCPGVRPVGIGECLRRVMAKAVMIVAGRDVLQACGSDQLCSGLESGMEAAVHALGDLFNEHKGNGWVFYLSTPQTPSTLCTGKWHCGMHTTCGPVDAAPSSTVTRLGPLLSSQALLLSCIAKKTSPKGTLFL